MAGESPLVLAIASAELTRAPWADAAIDALAAHAMTMLNRARTLVHDRDERAALARWLEA